MCCVGGCSGCMYALVNEKKWTCTGSDFTRTQQVYVLTEYVYQCVCGCVCVYMRVCVWMRGCI